MEAIKETAFIRFEVLSFGPIHRGPPPSLPPWPAFAGAPHPAYG